MSGALAGVKVVEVAAWTFVPAAGAVLADWGADVIKVEHPVTGDPQRGLRTMGLLPGGDSAVNFIIEQPNRGKRSIGLDISTEHGLRLLHRMVETADVFLTSFMPDVRQRLKIDVDDIKAVNPRIVYARGTGQGARGPDAGKGGYDGASYWARGGVSEALTPACAEYPIGGRPAFGDLAGGMSIAGGIVAALFQRERTGEAPVVDVSLLSQAMWMLSPDIVACGLYGKELAPKGDFNRSPIPLVGPYKTKDGRYLTLMLLQGDRFWPELCEHIGRPELATDERFSTDLARMTNRDETFALLDEAFGSRTLDEWKEALQTMKGVWAPVQKASELVDDPQVQANGYLSTLNVAGTDFDLVQNPVQLGETPDVLTPAPEHGQHTEEILLELGIDWDEITEGKESGAIL